MSTCSLQVCGPSVQCIAVLQTLHVHVETIGAVQQYGRNRMPGTAFRRRSGDFNAPVGGLGVWVGLLHGACRAPRGSYLLSFACHFRLGVGFTAPQFPAAF